MEEPLTAEQWEVKYNSLLRDVQVIELGWKQKLAREMEAAEARRQELIAERGQLLSEGEAHRDEIRRLRQQLDAAEQENSRLRAEAVIGGHDDTSVPQPVDSSSPRRGEEEVTVIGPRIIQRTSNPVPPPSMAHVPQTADDVPPAVQVDREGQLPPGRRRVDDSQMGPAWEPIRQREAWSRPQGAYQHPATGLQPVGAGQTHTRQVPGSTASRMDSTEWSWADLYLGHPVRGTGQTLPRQDLLPTYPDGKGGSWDHFMDKWVRAVRPYNLPDEKLVMLLANCLGEEACDELETLIKEKPGAVQNIHWTIQTLTTKMEKPSGQRSRAMWTLKQKDQTVAAFHKQVNNAGKNAYPYMGADQLDRVMLDCFVSGLRGAIRAKVDWEEPKTLKEAVQLAKKAEDQEEATKRPGNVVVARETKTGRKYDRGKGRENDKKEDVSGLREEMKRLAELVKEQVRGQQTREKRAVGNEPKPREKRYDDLRVQRGAMPTKGSHIQCYGCLKWGHYARDCGQKRTGGPPKPQDKGRWGAGRYGTRRQIRAVNAEEDLSDDEFARKQTKATKKAASVKAKGRKLSLSESLLLTTCLLGLILPCADAGGRMPNHPLICGSTEKDSPAIWKTPQKPKCSIPPMEDDLLAIEVEGVLHKRNLIAWETTAVQCARYQQTYITQTSFLTDVKTLETVVTPITVTQAECVAMWETKECKSGRLEGSDGVYYTKNPANYAYVFCCRPYEFVVEQCSLLETKVFKKHASKQFESAVGDVGHCNYDRGSCQLEDQSMLVWELAEGEECEYQPWQNISGKILNKHFVSKDRALALTFDEHGLNSQTTCKGAPASLSDQGVLIQFNTPLANQTVQEHVRKHHLASDPTPGQMENLLVVLNAMIEGVAMDMMKLSQQAFWDSYQYTCHNMVALLDMIDISLESHPTMGARHLLNRSDIIAKAGPSALIIYPCTEIKNGSYKLIPMQPGNCTNFLPLELTRGNHSTEAFLNPEDNVIHAEAHWVPCSTRETVLVELAGKLWKYHHERTLEDVKTPGELSYPHVQLQYNRTESREIIFNHLHRLSWGEFSQHEPINELLATLSRQKQILAEMGVSSTKHRTIHVNTVESLESLGEKTYMAFLKGGHMASFLELWTFAVNVLFTLMVIGGVGMAVKNCCLGSETSRITMRDLRGMVAMVRQEQQKEVEEEASLVEIETGTATQTDPEEASAMTPPSYRKIYPSLVEEDLDTLRTKYLDAVAKSHLRPRE